MHKRVHQQFEKNPYPAVALERSPLESPGLLYKFHVANAFYVRDRKVLDPAGLRILDVGCGTGFNTLTLALANPGAEVVGVDCSAKSLQIAEQRRDRHGIDSISFAECSLENLDSLGAKFDFINCNDTLYFIPNPSDGLQSMASVLSDRGIIRADLHNLRQRERYFRAQDFFRELGMMTEAPDAAAVARVRQFFDALHDSVLLKNTTWRRRTNDELILSNHLLYGDRGYTLREVFNIIRTAKLHFIAMVDSARWNIDSLFKRGFCHLDFVLNAIQTPEDYYVLYDLMNYNGRLYDFWCCRPSHQVTERTMISSLRASVQIHPLLKRTEVRQQFERAIPVWSGVRLGQFIPNAGSCEIPASMAAVIYPLFNEPQTISELIDRCLQILPVSPITMTKPAVEDVEQFVKRQLVRMERFGILFIESPEEGCLPSVRCATRSVSHRPGS